jgi:hypothetical protein
VAEKADVSTKSVQDAEAGKVPKSRMPYTLAPIAMALGWPGGAVDAVLEGAEPPGGWQSVPAQVVDADLVAGVITNAIVRATDHVTAAEIRNATQLALDELRRHGLFTETNGVQPKEMNRNA